MLSRCARRSALIYGLTSAIALSMVGSARADSVPLIYVGPIRAAHGYSVVVEASCAGATPGLSVLIAKKKKNASFLHVYSDVAGGVCDRQSMEANWPGILQVHLKLRPVGTVSRTTRCGINLMSQPLASSGTVRVHIRSKLFGDVAGVNPRGAASTLAYTPHTHIGCPPSPGIRMINALPAGHLVTVAQKPDGATTVTASFAEPKRNGLKTSSLLELYGGRSLFTSNADLSSAQIHSVSGVERSSLKFTAGPSCRYQHGVANAGTMSGTLRWNEPGYSPALTLDGASLGRVRLEKDDGSAGLCG